MEKTLLNFTEIISKLVNEETEKPIADHIPSEILFQKLDLDLPETATNEADFKAALYELVRHTPKTGTNRFFNHLRWVLKKSF